MGWFPYIPRQRNDQGADNITRLIMEQGRIAGDRAHNQGQIWGNAAANVGQIAAGAVEQHQLKKRDKAATAIIDGWDGQDPNALLQGLTKVYGPQDGPRVAQSVVEFRRAAGTGDDMDLPGVQAYAGFLADQDDAMVENQWGSWLSKAGPLLQKTAGVPPEAFSQPVTTEQKRQLLQAISGKAKAAPKTREVKRRNPDGSETIEIVNDIAGQSWTSAPEPPRAPSYQHVTTAQGIQPFDPTTGTLGNVIGQPPPPASAGRPQLEKIETVDEQGRPVTRFVEARAGASFPKPTGGAGKPATGQQRKALSYFNRGKEAQDIATSLEEGQKISPSAIKYTPGLANFVLSDSNQAYQQAQRAFTEARLRKESGAAVPTEEYRNDALTYFAQPGDSAATLAQKRAARNAVLAGIAFEAGDALKEFYGDEADGMIEKYKGLSKAKDSGTTVGRFKVEVE
jgi:hypothetical protein